MTSQTEGRRVLMVSPKRDVDPVLSQLRAVRHEVSVVEDLDEAASMLRLNAFDMAVVPVGPFRKLLDQRAFWEGSDGDSWRRSTAAISHDLAGLLTALGEALDDSQQATDQPNTPALETLAGSIRSLASFTQELTQELAGTGGPEAPTPSDLQDLVEAAAVAIYPSATHRGQRLTIDIDPDVAVITTTPVHLKRALKNLLEFASSRVPERGHVAIRATKDHAECLISVSAVLEDFDHSELGSLISRRRGGDERPGPLALAQEIVSQIDARLWIESERGGNVSVFIAVPTWEQPAPTPQQTARGITA